MADIEAMFPVYFPKAKQEGETDEDYNTAVSQNENCCNQNFKILYDALADVQKSIAALMSSGE